MAPVRLVCPTEQEPSVVDGTHFPPDSAATLAAAPQGLCGLLAAVARLCRSRLVRDARRNHDRAARRPTRRAVAARRTGHHRTTGRLCTPRARWRLCTTCRRTFERRRTCERRRAGRASPAERHRG